MDNTLKKLVMKRIISFFLLVLVLGGCRKDGAFKGQDNAIASFQLSMGGNVLKAYIQQDSIVVTAPGNLSLAGAVPAVVISEGAQIDPNPSSITDWEKSQKFTVTSHDGLKRMFTYVLVRNVISKNGNIILMTQADVDTLANMKLEKINGSLTIGRTNGTDSITSLAGLTSLKSVVSDLIINPTFAGKDLTGLDNLETVGGFGIGQDHTANTLDHGPVMKLKTINLPKLTEIFSNMIINGAGITSLQLPVLKKVDLGMAIVNVDSLTTIELPKLEVVLQSLNLPGASAASVLTTINFPALTSVGGDITVTSWTKLAVAKFPVLASAASFTVLGENLLTTVDASKLQTTLGAVELSFNPLLTSIDLSSLRSVGGQLHIEGAYGGTAALQDLNLKSLVSIGGNFTVGSQPMLTSLASLKSLQSVGGNFTLQNLDVLSDPNLDGFSGLKTIGGTLGIYSVPFQNWNGWGVTKVQSLTIFGTGVTTIQHIDVSKIAVSGPITFHEITGGATIKGPDVFDGTLAFEESEVVVSGFSTVHDVIYTFSGQPAGTALTLPFKKIINGMSVTVVGYNSLSFPNLQEVDTSFSISPGSPMDVSLPALKKTGAFILDMALTNSDLLSLPLLESVNGDFSVYTAFDTYSLGDIQAPKLKTVNGVLNLLPYDGYANTRMTNLNGFSALTSAKGVTISNNTALTDYTGLKNMIGSVGVDTWNVTGNGYDPAYQDMLDGKYVQ